jgi:hypothetical protein
MVDSPSSNHKLSTPVYKHLSGVESWDSADTDTRIAFYGAMKGRAYGRESILDAWNWFLIGRTGRPAHETTPAVSNDALEILREVSTLDCFHTGSSCPPDCQCLSARAGRAAHEALGDDARDSARYRFLRQPGNAIVYAQDRNAWGQNASGHVRYDLAEQLDAAVDAAMAKSLPVDPSSYNPCTQWNEDGLCVSCGASMPTPHHESEPSVSQRMRAAGYATRRIPSRECDCESGPASECSGGTKERDCTCDCHDVI